MARGATPSGMTLPICHCDERRGSNLHLCLSWGLLRRSQTMLAPCSDMIYVSSREMKHALRHLGISVGQGGIFECLTVRPFCVIMESVSFVTESRTYTVLPFHRRLHRTPPQFVAAGRPTGLPGWQSSAFCPCGRSPAIPARPPVPLWDRGSCLPSGACRRRCPAKGASGMKDSQTLLQTWLSPILRLPPAYPITAKRT